MARYLWITFALIFLSIGAYSFFFDEGALSLHSYVVNGDLLTLETRHTAEEIMEAHRDQLIGTTERIFQTPSLYFYPYLLLDVKFYDKNNKTRESTTLFSLVDGEMVLDTDTWEMTRGFEDTLQAGATLQEFQILNLIASSKGSLTKEKIQKELNSTPDVLNSLFRALKEKKLIITRGNDVVLHFENPLFNVVPQTKMGSDVVIKPFRQGKNQGKTISARFSPGKIERNAKAAFGNDFTIKDRKKIYLPVWRLPLLNPDGSLLITEWNALSGEKINSQKVLR